MVQNAPHLLYFANGSDYHIRKWLPAIAGRGIRITLATFTPPDDAIPEVQTVPLRRAGAERRSALKWFDYTRTAPAARRLIAASKPDAVVGSFATTYGWMAFLAGAGPLIVQTWSRDVTVVPWVGLKRFLYRPVARKVLRSAAAITTDGPAYAEVVRQRFPDVAHKVHATTWGISLEAYAPSRELGLAFRRKLGIPPDATVITCGRGVRSWYRPEVVLRALEQVVETENTYAVVLTLRHERTPEVRQLLERLAAHERVRVIDRFLEIEEMRRLWSATDIVVSVPDFDGVSEGLLEAMYAGAIPVVNDIPTHRSFLAEGSRAVYVHGERPEDLSETLKGVALDLARLKDTMGAGNRKWVAEHASIEGTAAQFADIVREVIGGT